MHGGLPIIGISVLAYAAVGAVAVLRGGLTGLRRHRARGGTTGDARSGTTGGAACAAA
ncbi:hypothetical protein GCM10027091_77700 [Streptomyces daliensis]